MTPKDFAKLLDDKLKPIGADISAIEARIGTIEKRLTTVEGQLAKKATKDDLKKLATAKQFNKLEKKLDYFFKNLDKDVMTAQKKVNDLEERMMVVEGQAQITSS